MGLRITGRRRTLALANIIGGVACLVCVLVILADEDSMAITALSLVGKAGVTAAFNGMFVFTAEIYPTEVRNVGLGTCSMVARISGIAAPYIGGLLGDIWSPMPSLIFGVVGTESGLLTFLLPETYGKDLPETIKELEDGALEKKIPNKVAVQFGDERHISNEATDAEISLPTYSKDQRIHEVPSSKTGIGGTSKGAEGTDINAYHNLAFIERL